MLHSISNLLFLRVRIIFAGDDVTDEDAINALKGMAMTFRIVSNQVNIHMKRWHLLMIQIIPSIFPEYRIRLKFFFQMTKTKADKRLPSTDSVVTLLKWVERHMSIR